MMAMDPEIVASIRSDIAMAKAKPTDGERQAFNEGVVTAAMALGAIIDEAKTTSPEAALVLETAYRAILGVKDRALLDSPKRK